MDPQDLHTALRLAIAVLLGALVGLQREQAQSRLGGVRTFPLVALLGAFAAFVSGPGAWPVAAGLVALTGVMAAAGRGRNDEGGITTEAALLATFLIGAYAAKGSLAVAGIAGAAVFLRSNGEADGGVEPKNPGGLLAAVGFGAGYALIGLLMSLGHERFAGSEWAVAAVSGLIDVDAVTLSTARLARGGALSADLAWRLALVAAASNTAFKAALVSVVSRRALALRLGLPLCALAGAAGAIAVFWPGWG